MYRSIQNLLESRVSLVNTLTNSTYAKDETRNETNNWNVATHSSRRKSLYRRAFRATRRKFGRPDSYRFEGMFAGCWRCRDSVGGRRNRRRRRRRRARQFSRMSLWRSVGPRVEQVGTLSDDTAPLHRRHEQASLNLESGRHPRGYFCFPFPL